MDIDDSLIIATSAIATPARTYKYIVLKPTLDCNADCDYCYVIEKEKPKWSVAEFINMFDKLEPHLDHNCTIAWLGGEPMLLSPEFYDECCNYIKSKINSPKIIMHSNLTRYSSRKWSNVIKKHFNSSVYTSYDVDEQNRTINGDPELYAIRFKKGLSECSIDNISTHITTVIDSRNMHALDDFFDFIASVNVNKNILGVDLEIMRYNKKMPVNTALKEEEIDRIFVKYFRKWVDNKYEFDIEPYFQILLRYFKIISLDMCCYSNSCASTALVLATNGNISTCDELMYRSNEYILGNLKTDTMSGIVKHQVLKKIAISAYEIPIECHECEAFDICGCGCFYLRGADGESSSRRSVKCQRHKTIYKEIKKLDEQGKLLWIKSYLMRRYMEIDNNPLI